MATKPLNATTLRVRAPRKLRSALQRIADRRFISFSDVAREALRNYVTSQTPPEEKKEVAA